MRPPYRDCSEIDLNIEGILSCGTQVKGEFSDIDECIALANSQENSASSILVVFSIKSPILLFRQLSRIGNLIQNSQNIYILDMLKLEPR